MVPRRPIVVGAAPTGDPISTRSPASGSKPNGPSAPSSRRTRRPSDHGPSSRRRASESADRAASSTSAAAGDKDKQLSQRTRENLSAVPCKFFRQGHCAAGDRCHFRHDLDSASDEDEYEVVKNACNWFQKGQCKFGNRCALPHVMPGEPRSADRRGRRKASAPREPLAYDAHAHPEYSPVDAYFQVGYSYSGLDVAASPIRPVGPPPGSMIGAPPFPPSPTKRTWSDVLANPARPRDQDDLSPVRRAHIVGPAHSSSPPLPSPLGLPDGPPHIAQQSNSASVFGTSPFSAPGSRSIFLGPSSFDSTADENGFARMNRTPSGVPAASSGPIAMASAASGEDDLDGLRDEDAVPSSLSELLTEEEIERRRERHATPRQANDARSMSRSVPSSFLDGPPMASTSVSLAAQHAKASAAAAMLGSSPHALGSTPPLLTHSTAPVALPPFIQRVNTYLANSSANGLTAAGGGASGSLPPGLAAGLSRLHFQPAVHSGNTPPSGQPSPNFPPASSPTHAPPSFNLRPGGIGMARRASGHNASALGGGMVVGSPLARTVSWLGDDGDDAAGEGGGKVARPATSARAVSYTAEDDVPFDMDDLPN